MANSGINLEHSNPGIRPQDDLFRHVNGRWLETAQIPDDRPLEGSFTALRDASEQAVRELIDDAAAQTARGDATNINAAKIGAFYSAFMDERGIEAAGLDPVRPYLGRIAAVADAASLLALIAEFGAEGWGGPFQNFVMSDMGDPDRYLLYLYQGGLGLPDESYYREEQSAALKAAYQQLAADFLSLAGAADPAAAAAGVVDLETRLAASHLDKVACRDPKNIYNPTTAQAAVAASPWLQGWLDAVFRGREQPTELVVSQPAFFARLTELLDESRLQQWKDWLSLHLLLGAAPYLGAEVVELHFGFYGRAISGTPTNKERWKRGVAFVEGALGEAVGQLYVERHFPQAHKERMAGLVSNLLTAYRDSISALSWMSGTTISQALEKLERFSCKIGYPEKWIDYSSLQPGANLIESMLAASRFQERRDLDKLGGPVDRLEWHMTPQTVNAYYNPTMNEIVFPAAILQPPFFDADADPAANYGAIGAVIGHEIGHGFDDKGSQYDGSGQLLNWWTDEDRAAFDELTGRLVDQFNALIPEEAPDGTVNGALTLGENIGDLGGIAIAHRAYRSSLGGAEPPVIDGLTGDQRFFYSWAECWRQKIRPEEALRRLTIDPHSPNEFRCNAVVRNLPEFHEAFGVRPGDKLYLAPAERVRIW